MAKTKAKKAVSAKKRLGSPSLSVMLESLKKKAGPKGISLAEKLIGSHAPEIIALAYRLMPKVTATLNKSQTETYEQLKKADPKRAETYKRDKLAARVASRVETYKKKLV